MEKRKYYRGLDILRGISALLVMLYHYTARYNEVAFTPPHLQTNWAINLPWASMAVVTFFLLSGFLCNAYGEEKPFKYVGKRLLRLYPAFLTALICTSLVTFFFCRPAFAGFKNIILNLTMLPGLLGARVVDGVYWTLQYEIIFFVIIGALFFLKKKMLKKGIFIAWLVLGIAVAFLRKFDNIFIG